MLRFVEVIVIVMMMVLLSDIVTSRQFLLDFSTGVENVKVEGKTVTLIFNTSELAPVRKVTLQAAENGRIISRNCSLEEKMSGCKDVTSPRIIAHIGHENVSVVIRNFTARDAVGYTLQAVGNEVKNKSFNLTNEPLKMNSSTETPPLTTAPYSRNIVNIVLSVVGGVVVVVVVVVLLAVICIKFKKELWQIIRSCFRFFQSKLHRHTAVPSTD
ncbi:uncharacterized protein LOC130545174 isoform X1 [Triplophysa rosa]|uniref:Uncharacterized protein n=1 Tax=Triplophysa rosa TaxID=992332 RepID=A0A9W7WD38_TRIRA|nr:uncharacterized protein LOC130545174 isoform X1 [Triplophysa rosa]KAI7794554.1 hypothetical protein IRJ41_015355 [Triplophysa rosa]